MVVAGMNILKSTVLNRLTIAITLLAGAVIAASDPNTTVRREFTQAYAAIDAKNDAVVDASNKDSTALQTYVLYPYLQAARLRHDLALPRRNIEFLDQRIQELLATQYGALAVKDLRRAWLLDLAVRQQWPTFLTNLSGTGPGTGVDAELRCESFTAKLNTVPAAEQTTVLAPEIRSVWLNANRLPAACNAPFDWARSNNVITAELIEQRARLALKSGNAALARELAAMLPVAQAEPIKQWAVLIEKPQPAIDALIANPNLSVESAALQDGWQRLARKDQDAAIDRLPQLIRVRKLTDVSASPYVLNLALALAWSRRDEASRYFDRVQLADFNEQAYEWRARAALWAMKWPQLQQAIAAMPESLRAQARWRYWLARADEQLNDVDAAHALYQSLIDKDDNYYAAMAAARMHVNYAPHPQPLLNDSGSTQLLALRPGMQRAHELWLVQLRNEAMSEWTQAFATLQSNEHLAAAQLAHDWEWYDQAVAISAKLGLYNDYEFLYPRPYDSEVDAAAKLSGLSPNLIYGVMRQETLFRADAKSSANARGLLQLLPETARITARKFNLPPPAADDLYNPVVNVPLGAVYLKTLVDGFNGQVVLALAAYNAGPAAARRWLPDSALDTDIWIENIPYNETRTYVQRVLWHSLVFHWLRMGKPMDTQPWLAPIQP